MTLLESEPSAIPRRTGRRAGFHAIRLLDVDPDLGGGLDATAFAVARGRVVVPGLRVGAGPWNPGPGLERAIAVLVVDGLILRASETFGRANVHVYGPGDLLEAPALADGSRWTALDSGTAAIIDGRFVMAARQWPQLIGGITKRLFECQREQETLAAITRMPRVEDRILALLSRLVERWGCVTSGGLAVDLPVTHRVLGQMVGAQRPTVSLALTALTEQGLLSRMGDGRWLLPPEALEWATDGLPARPAAARA